MLHMLRIMSLLWVGQVDIGRWLWVVALRLDESGLEMDDIFAQRVVLGLDLLVVVLQRVQIANLLLEFLDISFFPLTKCSL